MNKFHRFRIRLRLRAPFLSQRSGARRIGLDTAVERDHKGRPCLPGTLVKGNLRHAWQELARFSSSFDQATIDSWLGGAAESGSWEPQRGRLNFSEFWSASEPAPELGTGRLYRIQIDDETGSVAPGALQVIESPYPPGTEVTLEGEVSGWMSAQEADGLEQLLSKGLAFVSAFGALKGIGMGENLGVTIERCPAPSPVAGAAALSPEADRLGLRLCPDRAFCFATPRQGAGDNHFETTTHIPGGAIVAALKHALDQQPEDAFPYLRQHLDELHIAHALPLLKIGDTECRPIAMPHSVAVFDGETSRLVDTADMDETDLLEQMKAPRGNGQAPRFPIDWKDSDRNVAEEHYRQGPGVAKALVIRTAIDADTGTAADEQLFSMETVIPGATAWGANLSLHHIEDADSRKGIINELARLLALAPLCQLGKTKALAETQLVPAFGYSCPEEWDPTMVRSGQQQQVRVYLQSPARLLPTGTALPGVEGERALFDAYAEAWSRLSRGSLTLKRFRARQQLRGGAYWWHRYRAEQAHSYHPEILTDRGSVFVLEVHDPTTAARYLQDWHRLGLPQHDTGAGGDDWRHNPFIAANGYGEIAIDLKRPETTR